MNGKSYMFHPHYLNLSLPLCGTGTVKTPILQLWTYEVQRDCIACLRSQSCFVVVVVFN